MRENSEGKPYPLIPSRQKDGDCCPLAVRAGGRAASVGVTVEKGSSQAGLCERCWGSPERTRRGNDCGGLARPWKESVTGRDRSVTFSSVRLTCHRPSLGPLTC